MVKKHRYPDMLRVSINIYVTMTDQDGEDIGDFQHLVRNVWINPEDKAELNQILAQLDQFAPRIPVVELASEA